MIVKPKLLTAPFVLVCLAYFTFFSSFYFLLPTLPVYIIRIGGRESEVGLIIGVFALTAVLFRPFIGRAVDERGRKGLMLIGTGMFFLAALLYHFASSVPLLLLLRGFHGIGLAAFATASGAYVADIAPVERRGEAMGYFGMSANVAIAVGPGLGLFLLGAFDFTILFFASAAVALLSIILVAPLPEAGAKFARENSRERSPLFSRQALLPAIVVFAMTLPYGALMSFLPLYAESRQIQSFGLFFTVFAVVLILSRVFTGKLSDIYGRAAVIIPGLLCVAAAMGLVSLASNLPLLLAVGALYGLGWGAVHPALLALVVDRCHPSRRGAAMATFTAALDLGIGIGAIALGIVLQVSGYTTMYLAGAAVVFVGLLFFSANTWLSGTPAPGLAGPDSAASPPALCDPDPSEEESGRT